MVYPNGRPVPRTPGSLRWCCATPGCGSKLQRGWRQRGNSQSGSSGRRRGRAPCGNGAQSAAVPGQLYGPEQKQYGQDGIVPGKMEAYHRLRHRRAQREEKCEANRDGVVAALLALAESGEAQSPRAWHERVNPVSGLVPLSPPSSVNGRSRANK